MAMRKTAEENEMSPNNSTPGAPAYPRMIVIDAMPTVTGNSVALSFACSTPGVVTNGGKDLSFAGITKPIFVFMRLVGAQQAGLRFRPDPDDAAWFDRGTGKPTGPGNAGGRFQPKTVSDDGDALLFQATKQGQGGTFAALLWFDPGTVATAAGSTQSMAVSTTTMAAVKSGGPIIIND